MLRSRLAQLHPTSTEPPIAGVECHAFFENGTNGHGYVVCYIPESDVKPHRAELMEGKPYMLRVGDSFHNPSPSILRNLFFPRSSIKLGIEVEPTWDGIELRPGMQKPEDIEIRYPIIVRNIGLVSAKDIFAVIETEPVALQIDAGYKFYKTKTNTDFATGIECPKALRPSAQLDLCTIRHRVAPSTSTSTGLNLLVPRSSYLTLDFRLFATDMTPIHLRVLFGDRDIAERTVKRGFTVLETDESQA